MRSGQQVYSEGRSLVVVGSVNSGAEVLADGDIHIYGALQVGRLTVELLHSICLVLLPAILYYVIKIGLHRGVLLLGWEAQSLHGYTCKASKHRWSASVQLLS